MGILQPDDEYYMGEALREARRAADEDEIPVGAVVVAGDSIIARHNQTERLHDVTAHAEMLALTAAADHLGAKYLTGCTLYVTLEPCVMCAGALGWAQLDRIVYGADDLFAPGEAVENRSIPGRIAAKLGWDAAEFPKANPGFLFAWMFK